MSCPDCFRGHIHDEVPTGSEAVMHGRNTYVAEPTNDFQVNGIVVIIPDAFGWKFVNNRILADHYASKGGYRVYLPDFMDGRAAPVWMIDVFTGLFRTGTFMAWLQKPYYVAQAMRGFLPFYIANRMSISMPRVQSFINAVRNNEGSDLHIGAAGFCWGGRHAVILAHGENATNGKPLVDAVFTGHPSQLDIPVEIEKVKKPLSIAVGDKDNVVRLAQVQRIKALLGYMDVASEVVVYPGAGHGFCVRADPLNKDVVKQSLDAEDQAIKWFSGHFPSQTL